MRSIQEIEAGMNVANNHWMLEALWLEWFRANVEGISEERFKEICAAEREGRCVVLPCKVGDVLYDPYPGKIDECRVTAIEMQIITDSGVFEPEDIGEQVYFTCEAAEAKMEIKEEQI